MQLGKLGADVVAFSYENGRVVLPVCGGADLVPAAAGDVGVAGLVPLQDPGLGLHSRFFAWSDFVFFVLCMSQRPARLPLSILRHLVRDLDRRAQIRLQEPDRDLLQLEPTSLARIRRPRAASHFVRVLRRVGIADDVRNWWGPGFFYSFD